MEPRSQEQSTMRSPLSSAPTSYVSKPVVCLEAVDNVEESALLTFAQWIRGRRDEGLDLRLCAVEPHVHHLLEDVGEAGDALMPLAQATDTTPRRKVDTHLDAPKVSS